MYLQNRYNSQRTDELGNGCPLCDFTDLGLASTPDQGKTWIYRGVMQGLDDGSSLGTCETNWKVCGKEQGVTCTELRTGLPECAEL